MSYVYREVQCTWCDHIFMWNKHGREGLILHIYRLKETGKDVDTAKCPKCGSEIIVLDHVLKGIDVDDDRVEKKDGVFDGYIYEGYR